MNDNTTPIFNQTVAATRFHPAQLKMRVWEVARSLNVPSKEVLVWAKGYGAKSASSNLSMGTANLVAGRLSSTRFVSTYVGIAIADVDGDTGNNVLRSCWIGRASESAEQRRATNPIDASGGRRTWVITQDMGMTGDRGRHYRLVNRVTGESRIEPMSNLYDLY